MNIKEVTGSVSSWIPGWSQESNSISGKLQSAIDSNCISEIEKILKDPKLLLEPLPNKELPLHYAIRLGRDDIVKWIAAHNPHTLDITDYHGLTSLDHAIYSNDMRMIGTILSTKLNTSFFSATEHFSKKMPFGSFKKEMAFTQAVSENCTPCTHRHSSLFSTVMTTTPLHGAFEAAANGNQLLLGDLLNSGLDVNATTVDGWSLLHLAVKSENPELVKMLIDKGARVDLVTTPEGISPLHVAAVVNNRQVIQHLLAAGASLTATDKEGSTALHYAMTKDKLFSAQLLIEKGADCTQKNQLGLTPFSILAATVRTQCDKKDALKMSNMQYLMFAGIAASCLGGYVRGQTSATLVLQALIYASSFAPFGITFSQTKSLSGRIALLGTMGLSFIPGVNIAAQAWKTYAVGRECLKGMATAWTYRHIETARPIRNALILGTNAANSGKELIDSVKWAYSVVSDLVLNYEQYRNRLDQMFHDIHPKGTDHTWEATANYAFKREAWLDNSNQNVDKSKAVFDILKKGNQTNVDFEESALVPFDDRGTCSAMTLDFMSRMNSECTKLIGSSNFLQCVRNKAPHYTSNTEEFSSVQSAFNTIKITEKTLQTPLDDIAAQKMQSLGAYHNMKLTPVSRTSYRENNLKEFIEALPIGSYIVRLLSPSGNHKLENYGHTMGFIKREDQSIFYDNSKGARIIEGDVGTAVMQNLNFWSSIPTIRIYKAECPTEGCTNLATTKKALISVT